MEGKTKREKILRWEEIFQKGQLAIDNFCATWQLLLCHWIFSSFLTPY